jgi:hypothetical protein
VTIYLKDGTYGIGIFGTKGNEYQSYHYQRYDTQAEALSVAFDLVEQLKGIFP